MPVPPDLRTGNQPAPDLAADDIVMDSPHCQEQRFVMMLVIDPRVRRLLSMAIHLLTFASQRRPGNWRRDARGYAPDESAYRLWYGCTEAC